MSSLASAAGKIITFYSYKGGTGRSMALANVAWLLANRGARVLAIDWDLEAPGLHRYFEPFLDDRLLERSTGVIDFVVDLVSAAMTQGESSDAKWYEPYSNILAHAVTLSWEFPEEGTLDFVPAGRQDGAYARKVNAFDWQQFYEKVGGGTILQSVRHSLKQLYDYILIDSRTGVSDTSGICTVQMPDELVVCFTLNRQSICGAAAIARSALAQRTVNDQTTLTVWPVPMRVESFEKDRLELAQTLAYAQFSGTIHQLEPTQLEPYWNDIGVPYEPYYAYEELLAAFKDRPSQTASMLAKMERLASYLANESLPAAVLDEDLRARGLAAYTVKAAWDNVDELKLLAREYERIREVMKPGGSRTRQMTLLVGQAQLLAGREGVAHVAEVLFSRDTDGSRVLGLALARKDPQRRHFTMALNGIRSSRSPFEQFQALSLALGLIDTAEPTTALEFQTAINDQMGKTISKEDQSRWRLASDILSKIGSISASWHRPRSEIVRKIGGSPVLLIEVRPSTSHVRYDDSAEEHGEFLVSRGVHRVDLPPAFRIGKHLVTNSIYAEFIEAAGYEDVRFWPASFGSRSRLLNADGTAKGPKSWRSEMAQVDNHVNRPVSGICYHEAAAFVAWCNERFPEDGWVWCLPAEDIWEFSARGESGVIYPWGDIFDSEKCNSSESSLVETSDVERFPSGASLIGCLDMAGNVWEHTQMLSEGSTCTLRGGSYKNNRFEIRNYLHLHSVPPWHRAVDFGFRLAQVEATLGRSELSTQAPAAC